MSLKTEIDKTNELKNKTKKAKTNINNKLVELGGENANNLADVPIKIEKVINQNFKKVAILDGMNIDCINNTGSVQTYQMNFNMNLSFNPKILILLTEKVTNFTSIDFTPHGNLGLTNLFHFLLYMKEEESWGKSYYPYLDGDIILKDSKSFAIKMNHHPSCPKATLKISKIIAIG